MPRVGFESTIPGFDRAKTVHASDLAATVIGKWRFTLFNIDLQSCQERFEKYCSKSDVNVH
jgi:hypothetical protein